MLVVNVSSMAEQLPKEEMIRRRLARFSGDKAMVMDMDVSPQSTEANTPDSVGNTEANCRQTTGKVACIDPNSLCTQQFGSKFSCPHICSCAV
jgi:hypothetical protein